MPRFLSLSLLLCLLAMSASVHASVIYSKGEFTFVYSADFSFDPATLQYGDGRFAFYSEDFDVNSDPPPSLLNLTMTDFEFNFAGLHWDLASGTADGTLDISRSIQSLPLTDAVLEQTVDLQMYALGPDGELTLTFRFYYGDWGFSVPGYLGYNDDGSGNAGVTSFDIDFIVPTPATLTLLALGTIGLGLARPRCRTREN